MHILNKCLIGLFCILVPCAMLCSDACRPATAARSSQPQRNDTIPRILFLNYMFKQDTNARAAQVNVTLLNHIVTAGKLKPEAPFRQETETRFTLNLLDDQGKSLKSIPIGNPLVQDFEYLGENNQYARKQLNMAQWPFSIRLQLVPGTRKITLEAKNPNNTITLLHTLKLE